MSQSSDDLITDIFHTAERVAELIARSASEEGDGVRLCAHHELFKAIVAERTRCARLVHEIAPRLTHLHRQVLEGGDYENIDWTTLSEDELLAGIEALAPWREPSDDDSTYVAVPPGKAVMFVDIGVTSGGNKQ